jgi:hypothetical protein
LLIAEISGYSLPLTVDASGITTGGPATLTPSQPYDILVTGGVGSSGPAVSGAEELFGAFTAGLPHMGGAVLFAPSGVVPLTSTLANGSYSAYVSVAFQGNAPIVSGRVTQSVIEVLALPTGIGRVTQSVIELMVGLGISCGNPPPGLNQVPYSHTFPAGSPDPPYTFSIIGGSVPPGLSLNAATGVVSGVPTANGTFPFTIQVTDSVFSVASVACSITIGGGQIRITLRGVKVRTKCGGDEPGIAEVPQISKVDRAL